MCVSTNAKDSISSSLLRTLLRTRVMTIAVYAVGDPGEGGMWRPVLIEPSQRTAAAAAAV